MLFGGTHSFTNSSFTGNAAGTNLAIGIFSDASLNVSNTTVSSNRISTDFPDELGAGGITIQSSELKIRNSTRPLMTEYIGGEISIFGPRSRMP